MEKKISNEDLYDLIKGLIANTDELKHQNNANEEELKSVIGTVKFQFCTEIDRITKENGRLKEENTIL